MPFDPVAAAHRFHTAINELDFATIEDFFAENAVYGSIKVGALEGRPAIMQAFRRYFDTYPDQVALDELVERVSPMAARAVWSLNATHSKTGEALVRRGEETITFDDTGLIIRVDVTDY